MKDFIQDKLKEARDTEKKGGSSEEAGSQYDKVQDLLSNEIFNHSEIIRQLWDGEDDATKRSLFRKKLNRDVNDSGSPYTFDDSELTKIATILMNTSSSIRKSIGKSGKA